MRAALGVSRGEWHAALAPPPPLPPPAGGLKRCCDCPSLSLRMAAAGTSRLAPTPAGPDEDEVPFHDHPAAVLLPPSGCAALPGHPSDSSYRRLNRSRASFTGGYWQSLVRRPGRCRPELRACRPQSLAPSPPCMCPPKRAGARRVGPAALLPLHHAAHCGLAAGLLPPGGRLAGVAQGEAREVRCMQRLAVLGLAVLGGLEVPGGAWEPRFGTYQASRCAPSPPRLLLRPACAAMSAGARCRRCCWAC